MSLAEKLEMVLKGDGEYPPSVQLPMLMLEVALNRLINSSSAKINTAPGERIFGLSHGGAIFEITGTQATGYHLINIYTQPAAKSITATLDAIYVARGAYIDQLLFIDVAAAVVTTLLKPAPENSILVDDLATTATSGNIIAITCIGNSVQFLDGAAKALRFLCFGSSLMAYIK